MKKIILKVLVFGILTVNVGFSEYIIKNDKIYYNEDYHKSLVVKRIDDKKSRRYLTEKPDLKSFKITNENFAKDKDSVYYKEYNILGVDVNSFEILEKDTGKDRNYMYLYGQIIRYENNGKPVDMKKVTFYKSPDDRIYYFKYKNDIYAMQGIYAEKVDNVDKNTFEDIGGGFGRDKNWVYSGKNKLGNVDRDSFKYIGGRYIKDKNKIYSARWIVLNEDDLYDIKILENVDKNTFENIGESYSKDKNNVYFNDEKIEGIDPKTFKLIDNFFVKDKNNICYNGENLKNISPVEFQTLYISKNANVTYVIFFKNKDGVFKLLIEDPFDSSKNKIVKLNVDKESVKILSKNYYKDKNNVYCDDKVLKDADLQTFELLENEKDEVMYEFAEALENIINHLNDLETAKTSNTIERKFVTAQDRNHKYEYCKIVE